jgi:hypothetical protein
MTNAKTTGKRWMGFIALIAATTVILGLSVTILIGAVSTSCCTGT